MHEPLQGKVQSIVKHQYAQSILHYNHCALPSLLPLFYQTLNQLSDPWVCRIPDEARIEGVKLDIDLLLFFLRLLPDYKGFENFTPILGKCENIFNLLPFHLVEGFLSKIRCLLRSEKDLPDHTHV